MLGKGYIEGIMGITGPEGGGKTLLLAYLAKLHSAYGGRVLAFPGFEVKDGNGKVITERLDVDQWVLLPPELRDVLICIDETQNFFSSRRHMAVMSHLFASFAAQRRHRNVGIAYTVQDWGWVDDRIRWLTHVLAVCRDLWWTPWGKEEGIERGELIGVTFWDVKGFYTGKPWTPGPPHLLKAKTFWGCYDSWADVDVWSGMTKVELKRPLLKVDISGGGDEEEEPPVGGPQGAPSSSRENDEALLNNLANTPGMDPRVLRTVARRLKESEGGLPAA